MTTIFQTLFLWPFLWVMAALVATRVAPRRPLSASAAGMVGGAILTVAFFGVPSPERLLSSVLLWPLLGAVVVLFLPRQWSETLRRLSTLWLWAGFGLSLWLLGPALESSLVGQGPFWDGLGGVLQGLFFGESFDWPGYGAGGYRFLEADPWITTFGIQYKLGIDGISLWLVVLTTLLSPIALAASWNSIDTKIKEYAFSFLLLQVGMLGAFLALDLFLFYIFWELMLVPMYLIIGIWGGKQRVYAAVKFFVYTMVGSLLMLVAALYVVAQYRAAALASIDGLDPSLAITFDLERLTQLQLPLTDQFILFLTFGLAFAIKVPMFPFHTWLPDAHVQAPTGGSVILAAVLLKLGSYGFLRFAMPLFPYAAYRLGATLAGFAVVGILYGAACAWVQRDVKKLVAYSSVSHLGFVMLGLFCLTEGGISGAILQMVSHGISTGALFILVGVIYDRRHTREIAEFGGLARVMPAYATVFVIVALSSIGLPGTNGFVGEFMVLASTFVSRETAPWSALLAILASTGVILAAIYMLHAVLKMFWGPVTNEKNEGLPDLSSREAWTLAPLVVLVFWIGLFPGFFLAPMEGSVESFLADSRDRYQRSVEDRRRLLASGVMGLRRLQAEAAEGGAGAGEAEGEAEAGPAAGVEEAGAPSAAARVIPRLDEARPIPPDDVRARAAGGGAP